MPKPEDKSYTLSHYGAKDEDSSPVEAAYEPKSYAAILEGWEGVQGVRAIYAYPEMQTLPSGLTLPALV